jgi:FHA domain-containing protein
MRMFSDSRAFRRVFRIGLMPQRYQKDKRTKGTRKSDAILKVDEINRYTFRSGRDVSRPYKFGGCRDDIYVVRERIPKLIFNVQYRVPTQPLCFSESPNLWNTLFSYHFFASLLLCVLALSLFASPVLAQSTSPDIAFLAPPAVDHDQVTLTFTVRQPGGLGVSNLTAANFSLSEQTADISVTSDESLPMSLAVIVNLSYGSDLDLIQNTLRAYFNSYYRADDQVSFFIMGAGDLQLANPADLPAINSLIDGLTRSNDYLDISSALVKALDWLRQTDPPESRPRLALYVGSFLNDPAEGNASRSFALERIPFNVVQAHRFRQNATSAYRALANNGGGLFANNQDGSFVLEGAPVTAINTLKVMYDAMNGTRAVYTLHYRTISPDLTPKRTVTLTANLTDDQAASADFTYERQFAAPQVALVAANLSPRRQPSRAGESLAFDVNEQPLAVSVAFPDGVTRKIASLRLEVLNPATNNVIQSKLELTPQTDASGNYLIVWPLADYIAPGTSTPVKLTITAVDELGISATVSQDASVTVAALPPLPTPSALPTNAPTPEPTVTLIAQSAAPPSAPTTSANASGGSMFGILIGVILLLVVIVAFLMLALRRMQRRQLEAAANVVYVPANAPVIAANNAPVASGGGGGQNQTSTTVASTNGAEPAPEEKKTLGRLIVIMGLPEEEIVINEEEFVIGRKAESGCNYVIDQPYVSPRHCTFFYRNGNFHIRDLGAKNGTFVNGERIPKERDIIVPIGSEVSITQKITFELWDPFTVINIAGKRGDTQAEEYRSQITGDELIFRPMFGIKYTDDDDTEITDDYSPI